ncbi:MAG: hypothetical protein COY80_04645 [Candidatus Pacebacteria bacterium CG_4_10_14_0_8_um_filter_42_14]|nr:MAG: hypothetical protein COY80_04645 [Candidatus Pacebacteria bacterium CG_4_10_14_0_8_um_filter_42_14]
MNKITISALIIAKNEAAMIQRCIATLRWCDEVLVLDDGSTDNTVELAEQTGARVISFKHKSFARLRNEALKHCKTDWLIYVDADERVSPKLAREILVHLETASVSALTLKRENVFYGATFQHGGWSPDLVTKVFKRSSLKEWTGDVHESPNYEGEAGYLQVPLLHLTHRSVRDGLLKSAEWTRVEARLLVASELGKISFLTILRKGVMEFLRRGFFWKGYKDGEQGLIEALTQGINKMLVYMQVWELQQKPSIPESYEKIEKDIADAWKSEL